MGIFFRFFAHFLRAYSTSLLLGRLKADEFENLTGIGNGLLGLEGSEMLERSSFGKTVGISRKDRVPIKNFSLFNEEFWNWQGKLS